MDNSSDSDSDVPLAVRRDTLAQENGRKRKPEGAMADAQSEEEKEDDDDEEEEDADSEDEAAEGKKRKRASGTFPKNLPIASLRAWCLAPDTHAMHQYITVSCAAFRCKIKVQWASKASPHKWSD